MIESITSSALFDLSMFKHASLFQADAFVWEALPKINSYLKVIPLGHIEVGIPEGAHLFHPEWISIGKGTVIEPGAYIIGPCIIGENCTIRHGAYIRGNVIVGDSCVIGHASEVKNSILLNHSNAAHFAYLGDSILGNHVNLGAGTKCANLRLDHKEIQFHFEGKKYPTGLRKFGAIFGDGTQIGCNVVSNPGTVTGKKVSCQPCINFGGFIPAHATIKHSHEPVIVSK